MRGLVRLAGLLLLTGLSIAGCGGGTVHTSSTLEVVSTPRGRVQVDGVSRGETPLRLAVVPGVRRVRVLREGFEPASREVRVDSGQHRRLDIGLAVKEAGDQRSIDVLARALGIEPSDAHSDGGRVYGGGARDVAANTFPIWPRGDVRAAALSTYMIEIAPMYEGDWYLEFRSGGRTLHRSDFDPDYDVAQAPLPASVLASVSTGGRVVWGLYAEGEDEPRVGAAFRVVSGQEAELRIRRLRRTASYTAQSATVQALLQAQVLVHAGLETEALQDVLRALGAVRPSGPLLGLVQQVLKRHGLLRTTLADLARTELAGSCSGKSRPGEGPFRRFMSPLQAPERTRPSTWRASGASLPLDAR